MSVIVLLMGLVYRWSRVQKEIFTKEKSSLVTIVLPLTRRSEDTLESKATS